MRTLSEILEATKDGEKPEYDEIRYALLALESLSVMDNLALSRIAADEQEGKKPHAFIRYEESFNRTKRALKKNPKDFLGWNNDPENPEFQKRRKISTNIVNKIIGEDK